MTTIRLKEILDAVRQQPDLLPRDGKTYCNIALDRILTACGLPRLTSLLTGAPLMANDMIDAMRDSLTRWEKVDGNAACARASQGILVIACQKADGHGHVAAVYPAPQAYSPSWKKNVPMLNNIGRRNDVMRASQCFRTEPDYYSVKI